MDYDLKQYGLNILKTSNEDLVLARLRTYKSVVSENTTIEVVYMCVPTPLIII